MIEGNYNEICKASFGGKNRLNGTQKPFCRAAHGTNFGTYEGFVTDQMIEYYRARALGGFGLIIIEVTAVDPHGKAVTILEMRADIALDEAPTPRAFLMPRLAERGIQKIVNATVKKFNEDSVVYEQSGKEVTIGGFDTIVLAMGVKPYNPLEEAAKKVCGEVYVIGDAKQAGPANKATEAGLAAALAL